MNKQLNTQSPFFNKVNFYKLLSVGSFIERELRMRGNDEGLKVAIYLAHYFHRFDLLDNGWINISSKRRQRNNFLMAA